MKGEYNMNSTYIHEFKDLDEIVKYNNLIDKIYDEWNSMNESVDEKREMLLFMNESTDDLDLFMESENKNFFQKIGDAIINLIQAFGRFIENITEKVKSIFRNNKDRSTDKELEAMRKHPELAESFIKGIKDGSIKYSDYENIDEMLDTAEKLIKELDDGRIDKESAIQKFNKIITKFNDNLKPTTELLHTVSGAAKDITNLATFKSDLNKAIVDGTKSERKLEVLKNNALQRLKQMQKDEDKKETKEHGQIEMTRRHRDEEKLARTWDLKVMQLATEEYSKTMSAYYKTLYEVDNRIGKYFSSKKNKPMKSYDMQYKNADSVKNLNDLDSKPQQNTK